MSDVSRRDVLQVAVGAIGAAVGAALAGTSVRAADAAGQLSSEDVIRAWKDEEFRQSLSDAQRAQLPDHPAGAIEMSDLDVDGSWGAPTKGRNCCIMHTRTGVR